MSTVSRSRRDKTMGPHGLRAGVMAKDNGGSDKGGSSGWMQFIREMLRTDIYKRSQGRMVRQFTCLAIWAAFVLAAWRTFEYLRVIPTFEFARVVHGSLPGILNLAVPGVLLAVGLWLGFRIVNLPSFADFLIAVD